MNKTHCYTVSELTEKIKLLIEKSFPFIWINGELSNFQKPYSGHFYFTLKDSKSQINAVMFKGQNRFLKFLPKDGMNVRVMGRLSLYEVSGVYQIIVEYLEPAGLGELQLAFEQLKIKLSSEGLFDVSHKKALPFLPNRIAIITSATGAVIHDMITIISSRFPRHIELVPVKVQGPDSIDQIEEAIRIVNEKKEADVIILARGGGSLEDLQAFNSEKVARAIFASAIPLISAIGHETDYTIADFTADYRAPTPSAAAERVVPKKSDLIYTLMIHKQTLFKAIQNRININRMKLTNLSQKLSNPKQKIDSLQLRLDELTERLFLSFQNVVNKKRYEVRIISEKLNTLGPYSILNRGYSIARTLPALHVIKNIETVSKGDKIEVLIANGKLECKIEKICAKDFSP